jgi:hypothetical protein
VEIFDWIVDFICFLWIPVSRTKGHSLTLIYSKARGCERGPSLCEVFRLERSETPGTESGCFSITVGQLSPLGHSNIRRVVLTAPACRAVAGRVTKCVVILCVSTFVRKGTAPFFKKKKIYIFYSESRSAGGQLGSPLWCRAVACFSARGKWSQWPCLEELMDFMKITVIY